MGVSDKSGSKLDLYEKAGRLLRRANQISASIFHENLGTYTTPVQYEVLRVLREHPGIDQVSLAGLAAIDTSTAASVATRLEEKGLLTRNIDPQNRRQRTLRLTENGLALLKRAEVDVEYMYERLFVSFSESEAASFMALLSKLVNSNNELSRAPLSESTGGDTLRS